VIDEVTWAYGELYVVCGLETHSNVSDLYCFLLLFVLSYASSSPGRLYFDGQEVPRIDSSLTWLIV
jgi:hypothetical protein